MTTKARRRRRKAFPGEWTLYWLVQIVLYVAVIYYARNITPRFDLF